MPACNVCGCHTHMLAQLKASLVSTRTCSLLPLVLLLRHSPPPLANSTPCCELRSPGWPGCASPALGPAASAHSRSCRCSRLACRRRGCPCGWGQSPPCRCRCPNPCSVWARVTPNRRSLHDTPGVTVVAVSNRPAASTASGALPLSPHQATHLSLSNGLCSTTAGSGVKPCCNCSGTATSNCMASLLARPLLLLRCVRLLRAGCCPLLHSCAAADAVPVGSPLPAAGVCWSCKANWSAGATPCWSVAGSCSLRDCRN